MAQKFLYIPNRVIDNDGIATGSTFYFYLTGTNTLADVYEDEDLTIPLDNPLIVDDGAAVPEVFYAEDIVLRVRTVFADGTINDVDPYAPFAASDLVFIQAGAGAINRTVQSKLREDVSLQDFGVTATGAGSDQTTAAEDVLTDLGDNYEAEIHTSINTRLDLQNVVQAIPSKAILRYSAVFQTGTGYRQQLTGIADNPPDANTDTAWAVLSTHYPDVMLNNLRTAPTTSASRGLSGLSWGRGFFRNGSKGPRVQWQMNFTKSIVRTTEYGNKGVGCWELTVRSPERAGNYEEWFTGIVVSANDYILAPNSSYYKAQNGGTSITAPTASSGTQVLDGITWEFVSSWTSFRRALYVDELGRFGTAPPQAGTTILLEQNPEDTEQMVFRQRAGGASKRIQMMFEPTNASGVTVSMPYLDVTESSGVRLLDSVGSRIGFGMTDTRGLSLGTYGRTPNTAANGDTTPTVAGGGRLIIQNTGATSITDFDNHLPDQEVELYFTNSNTTLVHSGNLFLKGGVNVNPGNGNIIVIVRDYLNTGWIEKSRNF